MKHKIAALIISIIASIAIPGVSLGWPGCQCTFNNGGTKCLSHLPQFDCAATCASDTSPTMHVKSAVDVPMCPAASQQCTGYSIEDVSWTFWHQGAAVFEAPEEKDVISDPSNLKFIVASKQNGNKQQCIKEIPDSQIKTIVLQGLTYCKAKKQADISGDFYYAAITNGKWAQMDADAKRHDYKSVRDVFAYVQGGSHDKDDKQHELYCLSGPEIDAEIAKTKPH